MAFSVKNRFNMEKYKTYKNIDKRDVTEFDGLENEILASVDPGNGANPPPLVVESFGITFPTANYKISRKNSNYFVFEYVLSGKGTLIAGDEHYSLSAGCAYLLPEGSTHKYYSNKSDPLFKYWINFHGDFFFDVLKTFGLEDEVFFRNVDLKDDFTKIFELEKFSLFNDDIYLTVSGIIFGMIMKLANNYRQDASISPTASQIRSELDKSLSSRITLNEICKKLYISRSKLIREFTKNYGVTPYEYLLQRRLSSAKIMLKNTRQTVKSIAERLNFADDHYFCSFFKEKTGLTPTEYRKLQPDDDALPIPPAKSTKSN